MNLQRNILIGALLVITYLMVVQWNKDFVQQDLAPAAQTQMAPLDSSDLPGDDTAAAHDGDVPAAINGEGEALAPAQVTTPDAKGGLVKVETDTLQVTINPVGGDIVSLALPQYPTRKDRPDLPLQLLEQSGNRTYIAQSGLTGQQGPDKSSGRAQYSVEQNSYQLADGQEQLVVDHQQRRRQCHQALHLYPRQLSGRRQLPDRQPEQPALEWQSVRSDQAR